VSVDTELVGGAFDRLVLARLTKVRPGRTVSYGELAALVGSPGAARAVGGAMRRNPLPILVPCHRVLPQSGKLGNYTGGVKKKAWLLAREGRTFG
jgi:methylated-DNA-[protein]-cysteine S-methyltransferase